MLVEATNVVVLEILLFGVSIVAFLLWVSVVEHRRKLVRLQNRLLSQVAEGEKPSTATSTSLKSFEMTSTTVRHSRSNSSHRPISERAPSEHSIANADSHTLTKSLTRTLDEHIFVDPSPAAPERVLVSFNTMAPAKDAQPTYTRGSSSKNNSRESLSGAINQQPLRPVTTTTSNNRVSRTNGVSGADQSSEGSERRTKRQRSTVDSGRGPQGGNGGQNQLTKRTRAKTGRSGGNAPNEQNQAGRRQTLGTKGNAGKNNRQKEQTSLPQNQQPMFNQPGRGGMSSRAQQQRQPTPSFIFPPHNASQNLWSNGQFREPPMASGCYRNDCAYPPVVSSHQPYAHPSFGQPIDQRFMSAPNWAHNNARSPLLNAPGHPRNFSSEARILSPIFPTPRTAPQLSMASQASPSVASVTTATISTTAQGTKLTSDVVELQYSPGALSGREDSFEPSIEVEASGPKPTVGHLRSKSIPKAYNIDLEQGIKTLNRNLTFPQGGDSHIRWGSTSLAS